VLPEQSTEYGRNIVELMRSGAIERLLKKHQPAAKPDHQPAFCGLRIPDGWEQWNAQWGVVYKRGIKYEGYYEYILFSMDAIFHSFTATTSFTVKVPVPKLKSTADITIAKHDLVQVVGTAQGIMKVREPYWEWMCECIIDKGVEGIDGMQWYPAGSREGWGKEYTKPETLFVLRFLESETSLLYQGVKYEFSGIQFGVGHLGAGVSWD
jgi:hypothetical protein